MTWSLTAWLALHVALAAAGTWLSRRYALARRLVDEPGERRSHMVATPRGGGVAIAATMLVAMLALGARFPGWVPTLAPVALGTLLVAAIGWIDDHRPLSAWLRLAVHVLAAALLGLACIVDGGGLVTALCVFALGVGLVNVWNFMDGTNGLATSQAALVAATASIFALAGSVDWWLGWALVAACLGFLPFNFPRARIFLGDVGSGTLGYLLAALVALDDGPAVARAWVLLPLSAFLLDAALTLATRMVRGERWWTPHVQHLYQHLARRWSAHQGVAAVYAAWTLVAGVVAWMVRLQGPTTMMCAVSIWYLLGAGIWFAIKRPGMRA